MRRRKHTRAAAGGRAAAAASALALALAGCGAGVQSGAGEVPDRITIMVPFEKGGGTDTWARVLAPYLEKHLAGEPSVIVENVPGGESITGTNRFVAEAAPDAATLLGSSGTTYFQDLLDRSEVEFDFSKMKPLILNGTGAVIYTSPSTGIRNVDDLRTTDANLKYAGISATGLDASTLLAFELLKTDVDTTFGFEGRETALLSFQRGEVNIDYQTTSAYKTDVEPLVDEGKVVPLMSFGTVAEDGSVERDPAFPDLPTVPEVYERWYGEPPSGPIYEAYLSFLAAGYDYQKGLWAPQGTPDAVASKFYSAVDDIRSDPEFKKQSVEVLGGYPMYSGQEVEKQVEEAFAIDSRIREQVNSMLENEYGVTTN
ncbi:MAG: tripartite tricarboxylate transporter substrate-binding protein [Streptomycetales bacterium]